MTGSNEESDPLNQARLDDDRAVIGRAVAPIEIRVRRAIALLVPTFALGGIFVIISDEGPHRGWPLAITVLVLLSTIPAGLLVLRARVGFSWWDKPRAQTMASSLFIAYADVGVSIVLLTFADREAAMYGASLLSIVSTYTAHYTTQKTITLHSIFTTVLIVALAVLTMNQGGHDWESVTARAIVTWLVVNATLTLTGGFTVALKRTLLSQVTKAHTDPLTSLLNLRGLQAGATTLVDKSPATVGFMLIDLDMFKNVNDRYGHLVGDVVLTRTAHRLRSYMGGRGVIARRGGEEFLVVLATDITELMHLAESVRHTLHNPLDDVPVTVSIGVSVIDGQDRTDVNDFLTLGMHTADVAMYRAKSAGRNRVMAFDSTQEEAADP